MEIAKRVIHQRAGVKLICNSDVRIPKYTVEHSEFFITNKGGLFDLQ